MCHLRAVYCMLYAGCTRVSLCDNNSFQTLVAPIFYCNRNGIYNENCGQPLIHTAMYSGLWTVAGSVTVSPLSLVLTVVCWRSRWRATVRMVRRCHSFIIRWTPGNTEEWPAAVCTEYHVAQHLLLSVQSTTVLRICCCLDRVPRCSASAAVCTEYHGAQHLLLSALSTMVLSICCCLH